MKLKWRILQKYSPWLFLILSMDVFFCLLLWVADIQALIILSGVIILTTVLVFSGILTAILRREQRVRDAFENFIQIPNEGNEEMLRALCSRADGDKIDLLGRRLREQQQEKELLLTRACDYEEYVEAWAHETKTPISLLTILLDNQREDIPEGMGRKLDYIRNRMQEYVDQMLFYARLKGGKKDYLFEFLDLSECLGDILEDYRPLLQEKHFQVRLPLIEEQVYSDRRGLKFILSQIISNSLKYSQKEAAPVLCISCKKEENKITLFIADNGIGVRTGDLPYIFEKGFTGDTGENRKLATGMGLYLAKEIAEELKLSLEARSEWKKGFEMEITFPVLKEDDFPAPRRLQTPAGTAGGPWG